MLAILGGEAGCERLAGEFYARVAQDPDLKPLFPGKSLRCATEEFGAFLVQFFDGDPSHTQFRSWVSLRESHARFRISEKQRAAWVSLMKATVGSVIEDPKAREALSQFFTIASFYVIGESPGEPKHPELADRWRQQLALDQLMSAILGGRDDEAVSLAEQFASRPTVFAGILARMMDAGREPFVRFVLTSIERDPEVAGWTYNSRTLLHFASAAGCVEVVRELLRVGVDPDVLDGGGYTPLYRVANECLADVGAEIVQELIKAGALVNRCGGVTQATALHAAARRGNTVVAEALLGAGADTSIRDRKGDTPLDRASKCRKHEVALMLGSWNSATDEDKSEPAS